MIAGALAARRAVVAASPRRHRRRLPLAAPPSGAIVTLHQALRALSRELDQALRDELADTGMLRADAADGAAPPIGLGARLARALAAVLRRRPMLATLDRVFGAVAAHSGRQWAAQTQALGIAVFADPDLARQRDAFRDENLELITSLAGDKVMRVERVLAQNPGARVEELADRIRDATGATESRAALIARDQVLKANSQVTQARHQAAGVTEYIWRTSRDERVRDRHRELDGTRHPYAFPPVVDPRTGRRAHPGGDYQCRCTAEPIIPGFDDAPPTTPRTDAGDFKEGEHARDEDGRFASGQGGPAQAKPKGSGPPKGQATGPSAESGRLGPDGWNAEAASSRREPGAAGPPSASSKQEKRKELAKEAIARGKRDAEKYAATLDPEAKARFDAAVTKLAKVRGRPADITARLVSGAIKAAERGGDPEAHLKAAHKLASMKGLSSEGLDNLGHKALRKNPSSLAYIAGTKLEPAHLDFLARDPKTPWRSYEAAANLSAITDTNERDKLMQHVGSSIRGASAEIAAQTVAKRLGEVDRQTQMGTSELDYKVKPVVSPPNVIALEVKGYTADTWKKYLTPPRDEATEVGLSRMCRQLRDASEHTDGPPRLVVRSLRTTT